MDKTEVSKTLDVLILACLVAFFLLRKKAFHTWFLGIALVLLIINIFFPKFALFIATYWEKFGKAIGTVISKVVLTIAFYIGITPLSLLYRIFNKPLVEYFRNKKRDSFYKDVTTSYTKETFQKLW